MSDFKPQPREKNALDNNKFNLSAKNDEGFRASMLFALVNNNPRVTVYTNVPNDKDNNYGKLDAKLDAPTFMLFVDRVEDLARKGEGKKIYSIDNMKQKFVNNKPSDEWYALNTLKFGRDEDGQIWVSIIERNRPKIKFVFTNPQYHVLKNADGTDMSPGEVSRMYTLAWAGVMRTLLGAVMNSNYVPPKPREQNGGGNGGGGGGGNRGGGNFRGNGGGQRQGGAGGGGQGGGQRQATEDTYESEIDENLWG